MIRVRSGVRLATQSRLPYWSGAWGWSRAFGVAALAGVSALAVAACEDAPIGPSLGAVPVAVSALKPSQGNPGLCCCHVLGTARNDNSVPVHVTIKFSAFNVPRPPNGPDPDPLSTILYFIKDLQPGQTHQIEAPGFIFPCNTIPEGIKNVKTEVEVKGITYPPF
jgi:hypothetical protein